jgi:hypothetical protein
VCAPVLGVLSAAQGAFGAISGFQQTQAQNKAAIEQYKYALAQRKHDWMNRLSVWGHKRVDYFNQKDENYSAAGRAYAAEQTKLNEAYQSAAFQQQGALAELIQGRGSIAATGRTGRSVKKMDQAMLAAYGRNNATVAANLASARNAMIRKNEQTRQELRGANNKAWSEVALAPVLGVAPPKPQLTDGRGQLALGLLGAAVSGIGAFKSMKAPDAGNVTNSSSTSFSNAINMDLGMSPNFSNYSGIFSAPSSQGFNAFTMPSLPKLSNFSAQYSVPSQYTFR